MKKLYTSNFVFVAVLFLFFVTNAKAQAQTLADWTFESPQLTTGYSNTNADAGPFSPFSGTESATAQASGHHQNTTSAATYTQVAGNGGGQSLNAVHWAADDYWQFLVRTTNYTGITISVDQFGSATGPANFNLQASSNGSDFTTLSTIVINVASTWQTTSYSLPDSFSNIANLYIRLTVANNTTINGGTLSGTSSGTSRIDNVIISAASTTPIILDTFKISHAVGGALLSWSTKTELNASYFEIDKSLDGKSFKPLTTVEAKNISSGANYSYLDKAYSGGVAYYQLKLYDQDNSFKTSNILSIGGASNTNQVSLKYTLVKDKVELNNISNPVEARVINSSGNIIIHQSVSASNSTIDLTGLQSGIYFIQLSGSNQKNLKFIKQ